jgi:hypothetical protein
VGGVVRLGSCEGARIIGRGGVGVVVGDELVWITDWALPGTGFFWVAEALGDIGGRACIILEVRCGECCRLLGDG